MSFTQDRLLSRIDGPCDFSFDIPKYYLELCTAFITDGDLAIKHADSNRSVATRRSVSPTVDVNAIRCP
ncbi:MAG TPA: hypothetical protein VGO47_09135 [Chlamydiales bacterium]|nr:hypothetical protein [Chlamydiales bacterium]